MFGTLETWYGFLIWPLTSCECGHLASPLRVSVSPLSGPVSQWCGPCEVTHTGSARPGAQEEPSDISWQGVSVTCPLVTFLAAL